jgi:hypothetical protein
VTKTTRLTYKQTHELVVYCAQLAEQTQETWVALADEATEKLAFKVTVYSLKMALEAAGRSVEVMLKPPADAIPADAKIAELEALCWSAIKSIESFKSSLEAIARYMSAMDEWVETAQAKMVSLEKSVSELQEKVGIPF